MFHIMDSKTRLSAGVVVDDTSLTNALYALQIGWLTPFWTPDAIRGDQAFNHELFTKFAASIGSNFEPIPPRRHNKNVLESKHGILRSIFIRLCNADDQLDERVAIAMAFDVSNQLYGSDVMSAYELAHGFTKPLTDHPMLLPADLYEVHCSLEAKRKLTRILRSKAINNTVVEPGDMVEVFVKQPNNKRGSWTAPRIVLQVNYETGTITVPGARGHHVQAALEDCRLAITDDDFAQSIREANDKLDRAIDLELINADPNEQDAKDDAEPYIKTDDNNTIYNGVTPEAASFDASYTTDGYDKLSLVPSANERSAPSSLIPAVGDKVEVFWPQDHQYYHGFVAEEQDGMKTVVYDDGGIESLNFENETWRFASSANIRSIVASSLTLLTDTTDTLAAMFSHFGNKPFLKFQAQAFPEYVLSNAYNAEELDFKRTVKPVSLAEIPAKANIIASHTIYKLKINDDHSLKLKARIAPHGNEDSSRSLLRSDCSMCPPLGFRIIASLASIRKWRLSKIDVKTAFLQTGQAERDVYVVPPTESSDRNKCLWLLLTASYGLVNANAKWQVVSDQTLHKIGFCSIPVLPQLFYLTDDSGTTIAALAKIVDDFLICGQTKVVDDVIRSIGQIFTLGTIIHGPGLLRYFGLNIVQHDDMTITIDGDDKLNGIYTAPITRTRRRDTTDMLNPAEKRVFASINSSVGWLGITASPFCATFSSLFQQEAPSAAISTLCNQGARLSKLQKLGTATHYPRPGDNLTHAVSIVVFCDAGRTSDAGQLCHIGGLLLDDLRAGSIFHAISWASHKAHRPVRSTGAAEIMAAGEGVDIGKILTQVYKTLLHAAINLIVVVDSKDLYTTLTTQRQSIDRSIRGDVGVIRFEFEVKNITEVMWIPGKLNPADVGTKFDSPLIPAVSQLLSTGLLPFSVDEAESCASDRSLG